MFLSREKLLNALNWPDEERNGEMTWVKEYDSGKIMVATVFVLSSAIVCRVRSVDRANNISNMMNNLEIKWVFKPNLPPIMRNLVVDGVEKNPSGINAVDSAMSKFNSTVAKMGVEPEIRFKD